MRQHHNPLATSDVLFGAHAIDHPEHVRLGGLVRRLLRLGPEHIGTWPVGPTWLERWRCARFVGHCWHELPGPSMISEWVCCVCNGEHEHPSSASRCILCAWVSRSSSSTAD